MSRVDSYVESYDWTPEEVLRVLSKKYGKFKMSYEDLVRMVVYMDGELPVPYEETVSDLIL